MLILEYIYREYILSILTSQLYRPKVDRSLTQSSQSIIINSLNNWRRIACEIRDQIFNPPTIHLLTKLLSDDSSVLCRYKWT